MTTLQRRNPCDGGGDDHVCPPDVKGPTESHLTLVHWIRTGYLSLVLVHTGKVRTDMLSHTNDNEKENFVRIFDGTHISDLGTQWWT